MITFGFIDRNRIFGIIRWKPLFSWLMSGADPWTSNQCLWIIRVGTGRCYNGIWKYQEGFRKVIIIIIMCCVQYNNAEAYFHKVMFMVQICYFKVKKIANGNMKLMIIYVPQPIGPPWMRRCMYFSPTTLYCTQYSSHRVKQKVSN